MKKIDGDVVLFWITCITLGALSAYVLVSHIPAYWCGQ